MKKHKKTVLGFIPDEESSADIFNDPAALDAYLYSLGIGSPNSSGTVNVPEEEIHESPKVGAESTNANSIIASMFAERMAMDNNPITESAMTNLQSEGLGAKTENSKINTMAITKEQTSISYGKKEIVAEKPAGTIKPDNGKNRSNIALIRYVNGLKHISIRDFSGNADSVPVKYGETTIKPEDVDNALYLLYMIRKITGMPAVVYTEDEFTSRMLNKHIYGVDEDRFILLKDSMFEDLILGFTLDEDECANFIKYVKGALTKEELPDTIISVMTTMIARSIFNQDQAMAQLHIYTYLENDCLKDAFENMMIADESTVKTGDTVNISISDSEGLLTTFYRRVGELISVCDSGNEDVPTSKGFEEPGDGSSYERFDPYNNTTNPVPVQERKDTGASNDGRTFREESADDGSRIFSGEDSTGGNETGNVHESSNPTDEDVHENERHQSEESEEGKEREVPNSGGDRESSESEPEEVQKEEGKDGYSEAIENVDPKTFKFEDEKEEGHSMVISVTTVGKK